MEAKAVVCSECDCEDVLLKKGKKSFCRACWRYNCEFKFRKRLFECGRPTKGTSGEVFKPAENVLLLYDGSPSSVALINLALNAVLLGRNVPSDKVNPNLPFPFKFVILVILESELNGSPGVEGRQKKHLVSLLKWAKLAECAAGGSFPVLATSIEMSIKEYHPPEADTYMRFNETPLVLRLVESVGQEGHEESHVAGLKSSEVELMTLPFNDSLDYHLLEIRRSLKSKTEDKDFIGVLKRNLTNLLADHLQITKIILPEDQTSLSVKMFSMMSLGRGSQVADEMLFTSPEQNGRITCRPLIDFSDEDLQSYVDTLEDDCTAGLINKGAKRKTKIDSVERQCDDFISNLQQGYPATVSTLTRIGGKLQSSTKTSPEDGGEGEEATAIRLCQFCKRKSESDSESQSPQEELSLCYGCQHFLVDAHPDKKELFKNLFSLKSQINEDQSQGMPMPSP